MLLNEFAMISAFPFLIISADETSPPSGTIRRTLTKSCHQAQVKAYILHNVGSEAVVNTWHVGDILGL